MLVNPLPIANVLLYIALEWPYCGNNIKKKQLKTDIGCGFFLSSTICGGGHVLFSLVKRIKTSNAKFRYFNI